MTRPIDERLVGGRGVADRRVGVRRNRVERTEDAGVLGTKTSRPWLGSPDRHRRSFREMASYSACVPPPLARRRASASLHPIVLSD